VRDGINGKTKFLSRFPVIRRLNHQKIKKHWSAGLDVLRGKRLIDITIGQNEKWVKAHFDDGTTETGTTIIGADGGASYLRRWLLGDLAEPEALPCEFMNFSFTLPAYIALRVDKELNPTVDAGVHPTNMYLGVFLLDKPDLEKPETWVFYILSIWPLRKTVGPSSSSGRLRELRVRTDNWFDLFKTVVENIPDDTKVKPDQLRIWKTKSWNNHSGRLILAGDAAHRYLFKRYDLQ
jgi:2-polyprenyl-6-methoxyphenol hydroxylase-like FAD-dependent oxidoreductase